MTEDKKTIPPGRKCDRCGTQTRIVIGSYFNTDMLCLACEVLERNHKCYNHAVQVESDHCRNGNHNFEGIGLPEDLKQ